MIKQTIICDRCGKDGNAIIDPNGVWETVGIRYSGREYHLCPDCKTVFHRFMENLPVEEK